MSKLRFAAAAMTAGAAITLAGAWMTERPNSPSPVTSAVPAGDSSRETDTKPSDSRADFAPGPSTNIGSSELIDSAPTGLAVAGLLERADQHIMSGGYAAALRLLTAIETTTASTPTPDVALRVAICFEALGQDREAHQRFDTVTRHSPGTPLRRLAMFGKARCWNRGRRRELAASTLYHLALTSPDDNASRAVAWHLLGNALIGRHNDSLPRQGPLDDNAFLSSTIALSTADTVEAIRRAMTEKAREASDGAVMIEVVHRLGDNPANTYASIRVDARKVTELVSHLAASAGWEVEAAPEVARELSGRVQSWDTGVVDAATLLDAVLSRFDLGWSFSHGRLRLWSLKTAPPEDALTYRRAQTRRALEQAIVQGPDHRWCCHSYLALGRLAAEQGRLPEAVRFHEQGLLTDSTPDCQTELLLNLGRLQLALGERDAALESFYQVVDAAGLHPLQAIGCLSVGRLQIENGVPHKAVPELARGLAQSEGTPLEPHAACLLAGAYLLDGNPHGANRVLSKRQRLLAGGPLRDAAAFLSATARFDAAITSTERSRAAVDLLEAVSHIDPAGQFGGHWWVLCIRALEQTGLTSEADRLRRACLESTARFPFRDQVLTDTIRRRFQSEPHWDGEPLLRSQVAEAGASLSVAARLWKTESLWRQGHTEQALQSGLTLVRDDDLADDTRRDALRLLGRIYQQREDFSAAVACFAGVLPESSPPSNTETIGGVP